MSHKSIFKVLVAVIVLSMVAVIPAASAAPVAQNQKGLTIYMQMGGTQGDASTLARTNGAKAAAEKLGIKLVEQYSGWDPQKMIDQFKQAAAANPDGIVIMGHPGEDAFASLVDQAESQGIIITSGNNPLPPGGAQQERPGPLRCASCGRPLGGEA
ncbi:MAG: substrate-binding domain-containing protein [Chloroflexi bacterium]|nr:substrate-binding domain-containing protein [Chloroflexota bacterium]